MAIIPRDSKTNSFQDGGLGIEIIGAVFFIYILFDTIFGKYISSYMEIPFSIVMIALIAYLILQSRTNKGKTGYQRIMIFTRYQISKIKMWRVKHIWK